MLGRRKVLIALGAGALVCAAAFFLMRSDGYLLAEVEVDYAREHVETRLRILKLETQLEQGGEDAPELRAQLAYLRIETRASVFADVSLEDLVEGLAAADHEEYLDEDQLGTRGVHGSRDDRLDHGEVVAKHAQLTKPRDRHRRKYLQDALQVAQGVGAWIPKVRMSGVSDGARALNVKTLGEKKNLCPDEKFRLQPYAALGTAFLVRSDVVVTAAHVIDEYKKNLTELSLAFDLEVRDGTSPTHVRELYEIKKVLRWGYGKSRDFAIVRLTRPVGADRVLTLARTTRKVRTNDKVYLWGHSAGTPKKFVEGDVYQRANHTIRVKLDAFGGDSGAPVLNARHEVLGVFWGGTNDYARTRRANRCKVAVKVIRSAYESVTMLEEFRAFIPPQ